MEPAPGSGRGGSGGGRLPPQRGEGSPPGRGLLVPRVMPETWVSHLMPVAAWESGCWGSCGAPAQHPRGPSHLGNPRGIATPFWGWQGGVWDTYICCFLRSL